MAAMRPREGIMKLSELRPCDNCGGKVFPNFYVIRISQAFIMPSAQQTLGLMTMFNGNLGLAETFSPAPDAVKVLGDEEKALMTELIVCQDCYLMGKVNLVGLAEKVREARDET